MSWSSPFDDPIPVPKGKPLLTLKDAADYITRLPEAEQHDPAWMAPIEALILVAEKNGPVMLARIGIMQALNHGRPVTTEPTRKRAKAYKVLK